MQNLDNTRDFLPVNIAVLTVSDSRSMDNDKSGDYLVNSIIKEGHICNRRKIVKDNVKDILEVLNEWLNNKQVDVIIITGGTGITGRDVTPEAISKVREKEIPGFGEVFRFISYKKIGTSTIQSRASACIAKNTFLFSLPGSPGACKDAWEEIIKTQLDNRNRPCNLVELMPRLSEK
ncbi:MAG: Molybdenum cofactor biosynthesis protein B [Alphaproteobacteria bacterium MarineAlpha9_Bin4]|nr:MAG: Molybdenum cofactor biosynthesis protein B [Alphaproteobacteria bacterium MarineAlpha9_Bin4]|tara:strand:- start:712 stop:1242 length:531 start_codon:yes stop_codon:yes gene_type:complete